MKKMRLSQRIALFGLLTALAVPSLASAQAKGQDTFKAKCAMCHGGDGSGATPARQFSSPAWTAPTGNFALY